MSVDVAFLTDAHTASAAIAAGTELGLREHLRAPIDLNTVAERCGASPRGIAALLEAYRTFGLVDLDSGGRWSATNSFGATPFFAVDDLVETVRTGQPPVRGDLADGAAAFYPEVVERLAQWHAASAERAARALAVPSLRILDAGAGSAVWSRAIVARERSCRVVAVDLPELVATTTALVEASGMAANYDVVGADLFTADLVTLGEPFDLIIAANLLHLFDRTRASELLARLVELLAPAGRLAVVDAIPTGDRGHGDRRARLYGVHLLLRTGSGGVWSLADYTDWMSSAGIPDVRHLDVAADSPMSLVLGRR